MDFDTFGVALLGTAAAKLTALYLMQKAIPSSAKAVGTVSHLYIYPVKSCKGVKITKAECTPIGIKYGKFRDRHWMVVTQDNTFITQRQKPCMSTISVSLHEDFLSLDAPGMPTVTVPVDVSNNTKLKAKCWGDEVDVLDCGAEVGLWLSKVIGEPGCKLVYLHPSFRKRDITKSTKNLRWLGRPGDEIALVDFASYHIAAQSTIDDLNSRLSIKVGIANFRPNIVVENSPAFEEDQWKKIYTENTKFVQLKLCQRCLVTTVNQEEGRRFENEEPLNTLRGYRNVQPEVYGKAPILGTHLALDQTGDIKEGDTIFAETV